MVSTRATNPSVDVPHEEFCLPRPDATEPRVETFPTARPLDGGGEQRVQVARCLECGGQRINPVT